MQDGFEQSYKGLQAVCGVTELDFRLRFPSLASVKPTSAAER